MVACCTLPELLLSFHLYNNNNNNNCLWYIKLPHYFLFTIFSISTVNWFYISFEYPLSLFWFILFSTNYCEVIYFFFDSGGHLSLSLSLFNKFVNLPILSIFLSIRRFCRFSSISFWLLCHLLLSIGSPSCLFPIFDLGRLCVFSWLSFYLSLSLLLLLQ